MFEQRFCNQYVVVSVDETRRLVRFKRTSRALDSPAHLREVFQTLITWLGTLVPIEKRGEYGLIQDMRDAPMIGGPEMDRVLGELVSQLQGGWRRVAVIVRTAIGKLQARRKSSENRQVLEVFDDELEAILFGSSRDA